MYHLGPTEPSWCAQWAPVPQNPSDRQLPFLQLCVSAIVGRAVPLPWLRVHMDSTLLSLAENVIYREVEHASFLAAPLCIDAVNVASRGSRSACPRLFLH